MKGSSSLYLRDTGGQVEFQESISLVIFGPSIFFFVFKADVEFQSKFTIEYRTSESESTNCYTSSITVEEALLQCLASVHAMDTPCHIETPKPLVYIVGTHVDKLGSSAEVKISELDKHLDSLIQSNGFGHLVQYADSSSRQVMFAVDNTSDSDEQFELIRSNVNSLISGREEFTINFPMRYLLFCLELQNLKLSVIPLDKFKAMAAKYGIDQDHEVSRLLQFLHVRVGVIQYFDKDGLRHIVIKEPQILFNKVTNIIVKTYSSKALKTQEKQDYEKGILTASVVKDIIGSEDEITGSDFLKIMVNLRIIAPIPSAATEGLEEKYFVPCVLNHVQESRGEDLHTDILPLSVQFKCKHCPKGLFGVLVTHLMTPESDEEPDIAFTLLQDKIFKDQVSFEVHSTGVHDEMSLKFHPSHIEINFFPEASDPEDRDTSVKEVCNSVREAVIISITRSLSNLHYSEEKLKPVVCLPCEHCSKPHPVERGKQHFKIHCKTNRKTSRIPVQGRCWFNEGENIIIIMFLLHFCILVTFRCCLYSVFCCLSIKCYHITRTF